MLTLARTRLYISLPLAPGSLPIVILIYQLLKRKVLARFGFNIGNSVGIFSGFKRYAIGLLALH